MCSMYRWQLAQALCSSKVQPSAGETGSGTRERVRAKGECLDWVSLVHSARLHQCCSDCKGYKTQAVCRYDLRAAVCQALLYISQKSQLELSSSCPQLWPVHIRVLYLLPSLSCLTAYPNTNASWNNLANKPLALKSSLQEHCSYNTTRTVVIRDCRNAF